VLEVYPEHAMVLAAGLGLRMRPITEHKPKPLVLLGGRTLLDRALDHLVSANISSVTINLHYLGNMIISHLESRKEPDIFFSDEKNRLLDTGGGVKASLNSLGVNPFYVVNADIAWQDGSSPALSRLAHFWQDDRMDVLLLLHPVDLATGYEGSGDYYINSEMGLTRSLKSDTAPYVFTGIQLLHPRLFIDTPNTPFPLSFLYDRAQENGRLFGIIHDGAWHHIGTPSGLTEAEELFFESESFKEDEDAS
jgi:MurNAc alpha-1-phosphate uridylyltransferase